MARTREEEAAVVAEAEEEAVAVAAMLPDLLVKRAPRMPGATRRPTNPPERIITGAKVEPERWHALVSLDSINASLSIVKLGHAGNDPRNMWQQQSANKISLCIVLVSTVPNFRRLRD